MPTYKTMWTGRLKTFPLLLCIIILGSLVWTSCSQPSVARAVSADRVKQAGINVGEEIEELFAENNLNFPNTRLFIRVFKFEEIVEVWAKPKEQKEYIKLREYSICAASGELGPKRQEGDRQVPEGFYKISMFNPKSKYHLSLKLNYPNQSDKILTTNPASPGDWIMIHGGCASIGCVAITDEKIEELYWMAWRAHQSGQRKIPVHIFPCKMNTLRFKIKSYLERKNTKLIAFWDNLKEGFEYFEKNKQLPKVSVKSDGTYIYNVK